MNRIVDYPEAFSINDGDYVLVDNSENGASCIKAGQLDVTLKNFTINEASGSIATFDDGENLPLAFLGVAIEPIQEGSGDPSPTNPRPISGWTEANVTRCGKNLWGGEKLANDIVAKVPNATKNTTDKTVAYAPANVNTKILFNKFKPNTRYTFYMSTSSTSTNLYAYYSDGTYTYLEPNTYVTSDANKSVDCIQGHWITGNTVLNYDECGVFEGALTEFTPYNGHTYSITFPSEAGTVYGGSLDVTSGVLTVDRAYVDLGTLNWTYLTSGSGLAPYFYADITSLGIKYEGNFGTVVYHVLCSIYKAVNRNLSVFIDNTLCMDGAVAEQIVTQVQIKDSRYTSASDFKTAMNGVQLVYELDTPITYQLTPTQVNSLLGTNNVWADCGDVVVCYRKLWTPPEF